MHNTITNSTIEYLEVDPEKYGDQILGMFNKVFNNNVGTTEFRWKYLECIPEKMRTWAAIDNKKQKIAGFLSAFKMLFLQGGRTVACYQMCDGMVDPTYRGCGVFTNLSKSMFDDLRSEDICWIHGYANRLSGPILKRFENAINLNLSRSLFFPIGVGNLLTVLSGKNMLASYVTRNLSAVLRAIRRVTLPHVPDGIELSPAHDFDFVQEDKYTHIANRHSVFPTRSSQFLRWKAIEVPVTIKKNLHPHIVTHDGQPAGYCILYYEEKRNVLKILDLIVFNEKHFPSTLGCIKRIALTMQVDGILANVGSEFYQKKLSGSGFVRGTKSECIVFDVRGHLAGEVPDGNFWYQMFIDRDTFFY